LLWLDIYNDVYISEIKVAILIFLINLQLPGISLPFSINQDKPPLMGSDSEGDMCDQTVMVVRHGMGKGMVLYF
jgi:hypothetical protein